jgi:ATP-dependent protease ClpP protease subunit
MPNPLKPSAARALNAAVDAVRSSPAAPDGWYHIRAQGATGAAEVMIYDAIGAGGVTAKKFVGELAAVDADRITVRLNTPGGDVFDGLAIYNALRDHPATVSVRVDGVAASIGSIIAMAGDELTMADNAYMMIHNPYTLAFGDAAEMRATASLLDKLTDTLAQTYAARTGMAVADVRALMDDETWMTATDAVAHGFADAAAAPPAAESPKAMRPAAYVRHLDRVPDALRARLDLKPLNATAGPTPSARADRVEAATHSQEVPMGLTSTPAAPGPVATRTARAADTTPPADAPADAPAVDTESADYKAGYDAGYAQGMADSEADDVAPAAADDAPAEDPEKKKDDMPAASGAGLPAILAACGGDKALAFDCFTAGMTAAQAKAAHGAVKASADKVAAQAKEIERLKFEAGGQRALGTAAGASPVAAVENEDEMSTEAKAAVEFDKSPAIQAEFTVAASGNKDAAKRAFVKYRVNQAAGRTPSPR